MKTAIFAGSFDPVTIGHQNIINRAASLFDNLLVAVMDNSEKKYLFTFKQRIEMVSLLTSDLKNVSTITYNGLVSDLAFENNAVIIKAVRFISDMQIELEMALINKKLTGVETLVLFSDEKYLHISSTFAREMIKYNHSLSNILDEKVIKYINENLGEK